MVSLLKRGPQLFNDNITTMAEDLKKKQEEQLKEEQLKDEQLDEVSGGTGPVFIPDGEYKQQTVL